MEDKRNIQIIEWEHLDKKKFYVFGVAMTMMIRVSVYPFTLIRTRLQVQKGKSLYHGTFDAFIKILRADGVTGLYRGFLVNTFTLISGQCYVTTYELTRKFVADYSQSNTVKSLVAGGSASLVAQSITVPIDVVSQHLMMQRKGERMGRFQVRGSPEGRGIVAFGQTKDIIRQILRADGLRGFYRGYVASLLTYIPNSAVWWPFYHFYAVPGKWHVSLTTVGTWILLWLAGPRASADRPMEAGSSRPDATSQWPQDASFSGETGYGCVGAPGCGHRFHPHQSHGRHPHPRAG
ncbi:solute carrier family 25 member 44 isoform X7 [Callorhinus ursinus]|uniref:Solute carrier family 25 member 44 isoform X7 n=2 Tax=Callorhinus ursinus TaxID=34884 RepID=A0A3Q7N475_CALUR|nr:solute carrier family 25 member 44 isoform X7 [Callorhinus ursinus]XP_027945941.1 solute carrier family 25 member 44 isoform X8 [Eumetopias jubatus]